MGPPSGQPQPNGASSEHASSATNGVQQSDTKPTEEFDFDTVKQVRSLYAYEASGEQDASFRDNLLIIAHPPKDSASEWLYGMVPSTGSRGWLPKSYVEELPLHISCTA